MIAQRLLFPSSKLAHTRHWHSTTLAEELNVAYATEDHLYEAMNIGERDRVHARVDGLGDEVHAFGVGQPGRRIGSV